MKRSPSCAIFDVNHHNDDDSFRSMMNNSLQFSDMSKENEFGNASFNASCNASLTKNQRTVTMQSFGDDDDSQEEICHDDICNNDSEEDTFLFLEIDEEQCTDDENDTLPLCHQNTKSLVEEIIQDELNEYLELVNVLNETMNDIMQEKNELEIEMQQLLHQQKQQEQQQQQFLNKTNTMLLHLTPASAAAHKKSLSLKLKNTLSLHLLVERFHKAQTDAEHCQRLLNGTWKVIRDYQSVLRIVEDSKAPSEYTDTMRTLLAQADELEAECKEFLDIDEQEEEEESDNEVDCDDLEQ